ncbi:MAG: phage tail protein [Niallia sp.]
MYNTGQTAVFLKDLKGKEYPAIAEVNRKKRVNGQRELSLSFLYTEINKDFMEELEFGWKVLFDNEWYTITNPGYATDGDYFAIDVTAILSFFVELNGYYMQDKAEDKSSTAIDYFSNLFEGTPYSYVLVSNLAANTLSYQDNQSKTERFLYGIDRFNAEYKVQGNVAYIHDQIGSDKDVILHEDLNVNSVKIDVDASGFHTWAKGYGDLPEEGVDGAEPEYQLEVVYVSPLADKYGMIEGPAIKDGNYKNAETLTEAVKKQVENSYIVSTEIEAVDLTNNGYPEMILEEGDRVWLVVSKLNLNQQVRVMEVDETFDWEGNVIDARYVVGNEGIATRYKTQQYNTIKDFQDISSGRKKLAYDWLPAAVKRASEVINGNQDSLFKYLPGEIIGINQSNPNEYMRFNTDGIGFSRDGGKTYQTAITYEGIVADAITTGQLNANNITLTGVLTGALLQTATSGKRVKIFEEDYAALEDDVQKISLGFRQLSGGVPEAPRFAMGVRGMNTGSMNADGSYFVATHYPAEDNPMMNNLSYMDLAYSCTQAGGQSDEDRYSNIKFFDDGVIRIAPVKELHVTTNYVNGEYDPNGEKTIATFASSTSQYYNSHMGIGAIVNRTNANGLILGDDQREPYARVRVQTDSEGNQFLRPLTESGSIELGSPSFPWQAVYAVNGTIQSSSIAKKSDIHQVQPYNPEMGKLTPTSITTDDAIDFIHNLKTYTYVYKKGEDYLDANGNEQTRLVDRTVEEALLEGDLTSIQLGIIADEHLNNPIAHFILTGRDEETLGVQVMSALTAAIITIQDQEKRIQELEHALGA